MQFLQRGEPFRDFEFEGFSTAAARSKSPLLVMVWRIGCSTSRLTVPFLDRLVQAYPQATVVGICQETPEAIAEYAAKHGLQTLQLADQDLEVTRKMGVKTVPDYWLTDASGQTLIAETGWSVDALENLSRELARLTNRPYIPMVTPSDTVPLAKPG